jgi:hypothetical protein
MNDLRPSVLEAARMVDTGDHVEAGIMTIVAGAVDEAHRQRLAETEAQQQRWLDEAMADVVEVVRRQRTRLGRRVCSPSDGKVIRQIFGLVRSMSADVSADDDPSFGDHP